MCGIVGRFNFRSDAPVAPTVMRGMCTLIAHRGPDGEGIYTQGAMGFGHRRLAVIDLTPAAHQPMMSDDGQLCITYNGEIYNFQELRDDLECLGYRFRSHSDTEVVLASYRHYGVGCLRLLKGMFAFAIWDNREKTLFLARDRVGKKPLLYWIDKDGISFASEAKAFLADPNFKAQVNLEAISHYLTFQYVPAPFSAFKDIEKLPPGHYLLVHNGKLSIERYWKLSYKNTFVGSEEDAAEELLTKLKQAVESRLVSDVPLGVFLSGGIDSSSIVALMAKLGSVPLNTFSIGFEQDQYNELPYARLVANRFGTTHQEFVVSPKATEILPKLVWHYNEPFADSSAIPTFYLSQMTRQHVTVALNGDGGDECLAGYKRYLGHETRRQTRCPFDMVLQRLLPRGIFPMESLISNRFLKKGIRFLEASIETSERRYAHLVSQFAPVLKKQVCTKNFLKEIGWIDSDNVILQAYKNSDAPDLVDATLDVDVNTYLPDDILVKVDIATMAYGLEARSPFLDHEFMEFCAGLPSGFKLRNGSMKYIFKHAVKDLLPEEIITRPKRGFTVPIADWFKNELREMVYDLLLSSRALGRGYFQEKAVRNLIDDHVSGRHQRHTQLWNLLMLELWHRMFIDGEGLKSYTG